MSYGTYSPQGINRVIVQSFTSGTSTYTPTSGMVYAIIEGVGGGGGAGGAASTTAGTQNGAGGGGGGEYARVTVTAAQVGASQTVTVGATANGGTAGQNNGTAGNDTSVGSLLVAKGGSASAGVASAARGVGAAGGTGGTGDLLIPGMPGDGGGSASIITVQAAINGGRGGSSHWGWGGAPRLAANDGTAGTGYGGGGSGGADGNAGGNRAGGAGSAGRVIITEFCR